MKIRFEKENGLNKINVHSWIQKQTLAHNLSENSFGTPGNKEMY